MAFSSVTEGAGAPQRTSTPYFSIRAMSFSMVSLAMRKEGITCRGTPPRQLSRSKMVVSIPARARK